MLAVGGTHSAVTPVHVTNAVREAAMSPKYPPTMGDLALREAIAERLESEFGRPVDPHSEILITNGSMQALHLAVEACNTNGNAVSHAPSFFYGDIAAAVGVQLRWTDGGDLRPDFAAFGRDLRRTRATLAIVNSPCNPTGYVFTAQDIDEIAAAVRDSDAWLLSDEAMMSYVYGSKSHLSPAAHPNLHARTIVARSFSKMYSMGPWRTGYAYGPPPIIAAMAKLLQWSVIGVNAIAQAAALSALTGPQQWMRDTISRLEEVRVDAAAALNASGVLHALVPEAGAVLWAEITETNWTEEDCSVDLRRRGIPAVKGALFGSSTPHVRIPFAGEPDSANSLIQLLPTLVRGR
jgi:aspartate/methionine/tyrosine aminotransferase